MWKIIKSYLHHAEEVQVLRDCQEEDMWEPKIEAAKIKYERQDDNSYKKHLGIRM